MLLLVPKIPPTTAINIPKSIKVVAVPSIKAMDMAKLLRRVASFPATWATIIGTMVILQGPILLTSPAKKTSP